MKQTLLAVISVGLVGQAFAVGSVSNAHVTQVRVDADGRGIVFFDQNLSGAVSACGQDNAFKNAMAFNPTTGKGLLAVALAAKATGTTVDAYGSGACVI